MTLLIAIKEYLENTSPSKWAYNDFLSKNEKILIAERNYYNKWTDRNAHWKRLFLGAVRKMIIDEKIIQKLKNEKTDKGFWSYIEDSQKLEIIQERQIKLKRKVDLCSIEIYDKSTSQQGAEILDLYPPQKKICLDNESGEGEIIEKRDENIDTDKNGNESTELQFDPEKFREEIREEVRKEIRNEIRNKIRDEIKEICKEIRNEICVEIRKEIHDAIKNK